MSTMPERIWVNPDSYDDPTESYLCGLNQEQADTEYIHIDKYKELEAELACWEATQ